MHEITPRQYLCSVRDAAKLILDYDYKIMVERAKAYSFARSTETRFGKGGTTNPMHHIERAIDLEYARSAEIRSAAEEVSGCLSLLDAYSKSISKRGAQFLAARFIYCMTYADIAKSLNTTATQAEREVDYAIDILTTEGIARVKSGQVCHITAEPEG